MGFKAVFKGEDVEGDGGPYRQVFQDWSKELQPIYKDGKKQKADDLEILKPCANQIANELIGKDRYVISSSNLSADDL